MTWQYCLQRIMPVIRLADTNASREIEAFCKGSLLGTRILCQIKAYGFDRDFLNVWLCYDDEVKTVGVISKFEDSITLIYSSDDGAEEVKTFLDMIGFSSLCCTYETAHYLGYCESLTKKAYAFSGECIGEKLSDLSENFYRECYSLISKNIPDSFSDTEEAYLSFLSDFMFRQRRGLARIKGYTEDGKVLSCALTSAETENSAIISGVACEITSRKTGLGKRTVLSLAEELKSENKEVYVIALNEKAEGFYEHIGFSFKEKISFIERK